MGADRPWPDNRPPGPLTERYRPLTLADICGQEEAVGVLGRFAQPPYSTAYLFDGETGTGKTSAVLAQAYGRRGVTCPSRNSAAST